MKQRVWEDFGESGGHHGGRTSRGRGGGRVGRIDDRGSYARSSGRKICHYARRKITCWKLHGKPTRVFM